MKTDLKTLGLLSLLLSGSALAQTTDTSSTSVPASSGSSVVSPPGIETDRARSATANPASGSNSAVGILVKDGKAFLLRGGQLTPVDAPLSLTVSPDGAITGFDGKTTTLPDGQMLTMDGRITAIPDTISAAIIPGLPAQTIPDATAQANEEMARANSQATSTPTMQSNPVIEDQSSGGGTGSSNQPRRAKTGSTEKTGTGPK